MVGETSIREAAVDHRDIELIQRLAERLEHLSADSSYAHRASGLRGSLLRYMANIEAGKQLNPAEWAQLEQAVDTGFVILEMAAKEVGGAK